MAVFKGRRLPLRAYGGAWADQLRWGRLTHSRVLGVLANPSYTCTYVFGRYQSRRVVEPDGTVRSKVVELPRDQWSAVIQGHLLGYISSDDYLANQSRLAANLTNAGARPPRPATAGSRRCCTTKSLAWSEARGSPGNIDKNYNNFFFEVSSSSC